MLSVAKRLTVLFPTLILALAMGCGSQERVKERARDSKHRPEKSKVDKRWEDRAFAVAHGKSADGSITLRAFFKETSDGVLVNLIVEGLQPDAVHGIHIHENGICNEPDYTAAGPHFDPLATDRHGGADDDKSHLGDMGNIKASPQGIARTRDEIIGATLTEGSTNVVGRALILHAGPDDLTSQPSGNSGGRLVCAVIELGDKEKMREINKDGYFWKDRKMKDRPRKKMDMMRKDRSQDRKPPRIEQKPELRPDQPGSTTDSNI